VCETDSRLQPHSRALFRGQEEREILTEKERMRGGGRTELVYILKMGGERIYSRGQWPPDHRKLLDPVAPLFTWRSVQPSDNRKWLLFCYWQTSEASRQQAILGSVAPLFTWRSGSLQTIGNIKLLLLCLPAGQNSLQ
jgi:hypothetical protein